MIRFSLGKKLSVLLALSLILGILGATSLATQMFTADLTDLLKKGTIDGATFRAGRMRSDLKSMAERARTLAGLSLEEFKYANDREAFLRRQFPEDDRFLALAQAVFVDATTLKTSWRFVNDEAAKTLGLGPEGITALDTATGLPLEEIRQGKPAFVGMKVGEAEIVRLVLPLVKGEGDVVSHVTVLDIPQERLGASFGGMNSSAILVDAGGRVLVASDSVRWPFLTDVSGLDIVKRAADGQQIEFDDERGERQLGAYKKVGFAGLAVVSQMPYASAVSARNLLYRRMAFLSAAFLFLALTFGLLFSRAITGRLASLSRAAESVGAGDLAARVPERGARAWLQDEVDRYQALFNRMVSGLQEAHRMRSLIDKYHHKEFSAKLLSEKVQLGGEKYQAVILFVDLRGFTELGERMDPQGMVAILNRYMARMVDIVLRNGGIVDKFVGDAIMALWGVPEVNPRMADEAMKACLEMRVALASLNAEFRAEGMPELAIGMGMNLGPVVAGNIGSEQRMEYTVVGDAVNLASRMQDLTKLYKTDLLISDSVYRELRNSFVVETVTDVAIRGRAETVTVHKVAAATSGMAPPRKRPQAA